MFIEMKGFDGQNWGNSGIFLQGFYELQVFDSYNNLIYVNGQVGLIYKQVMLWVNVLCVLGQWQVYDIIWKVLCFLLGGGLMLFVWIIVLYNGVLVQDDIVLVGKIEYIGVFLYVLYGCVLLYLQEYDFKVSYCNIWVCELQCLFVILLGSW